MAEQGTNKLERISELSESHTLALTHDAASWANFLDSAANMYKYGFTDQVLIHAQRPDATACASMQLWNDTMHRWIKKGSKGIALIDDGAGQDNPSLRLKYVFDIADTDGRDGARPPYIWKMKPEHEELVAETLETAYEGHKTVPSSEQGDLKVRIIELSRNLAEERTANTLEEKEGAKEILASSIGYVVLSRCGMDTEELTESFKDINRVSDLIDIAELGETTGELARDMLSQIENTVKRYERQKVREVKERSVGHGDTVSAGRELPGAGLGNERHDGTPDREIRADEENVSERTQERALFEPAAPREADGASGGHRRGGTGADRDTDTGNAQNRSAYGDERPGQGNGSDGLGQAHEQPAHDGGRDRDQGSDLQLDNSPLNANAPAAPADEVHCLFDAQLCECHTWSPPSFAQTVPQKSYP